MILPIPVKNFLDIHTVGEQKVTLTFGSITEELPRTCPHCGHAMDIHQEHRITLKHVPLQMRPHLLRVSRKRVRCRNCRYLQTQRIPFKDPEHRMTKHLRYLVEKRLAEGYTLKAVSMDLGVHPSIVKEVDKSRLRRMFPTKKPDNYCETNSCMHRGHRYATVALDLSRGTLSGEVRERRNSR
jgi:transposase